MNNFFKNLFGSYFNNDQNHSNSAFPEESNNEFQYDASGQKWNANNDADDSTDILGNFEPSTSNVGFSVFNNPFELNKIIDNLVNDMQKSMTFFGFFDSADFTWEGEKEKFGTFNYNCNHENEQCNSSLSLRNSFLKSPDNSCNERKKDLNLDEKIKVEDIEKFFSNDNNDRILPNNVDSDPNFLPAKTYSQSVYIRTVRHPNGSIETVKKIRDHTGKEETIITRDSSLTASEHSETLPNDIASGISIFKKFFPF